MLSSKSPPSCTNRIHHFSHINVLLPFLCIVSVGIWTEGLMHTGEMLYHQAPSPTLHLPTPIGVIKVCVIIYFFPSLSCFLYNERYMKAGTLTGMLLLPSAHNCTGTQKTQSEYILSWKYPPKPLEYVYFSICIHPYSTYAASYMFLYACICSRFPLVPLLH